MASESNPDANQPNTEPASAPASPSNGNGGFKKRMVVIPIVTILVIFGAIYGYHFWRYITTHADTDDAYLTTDVIQISPQVSGTVEKVYVEDNQYVKKGDLLVLLDDSTFRAAYEQAKANLDAAIAAAKGAGVNVALTSETGNAQIMQAEGGLGQAKSGILAAHANTLAAQAAVKSAQANAASAQAAVQTAQATLNAVLANLAQTKDAVTGAEAQLQTAKAAVKTAQANMASIEAQETKAKRDVQRYTGLRAQGAVSEQTLDQAVATYKSLDAQVQAAREQIAQARSNVGSRQAELSSAKQAVSAAEAAVKEAQGTINMRKQEAFAAQAQIGQSFAAYVAMKRNVMISMSRRKQATGSLFQAKTAHTQVRLSKTAQSQALAKIEQMRAALHEAAIELAYTRIYAPCDGRVNKKTVEQGELVSIGTPLMALVPRNDIWVVANYKETQLPGILPGDKATIQVDAIPGRTFTGEVNSIAAASGATFALLPPDNATGNFTKVVQRIPVKVVFDSGQPDMDQLRAGMSVETSVATK